MDTVVAILVGIGLSAACGLRIFVGLLGASLAAAAGYLDLATGYEWIGSTPAIIAFSIAAIIEITAYYVPWLDNLLDAISTPVAVIAGTLITASVVTEITPFLKWTLALIAGGGTAGILQGGMSAVRGISTLSTAGFGNSVVSTSEWVASATMVILTILAPLVAIVFLVWIGLILFRKLRAA